MKETKLDRQPWRMEEEGDKPRTVAVYKRFEEARKQVLSSEPLEGASPASILTP